jgi:hypothetical protein
MTTLKDLKKGDFAFLRSNWSDTKDLNVIVSVKGRKWITVNHSFGDPMQFDIETGRDKDGICRYTLYPSREVYEQEQATINSKKYLLFQIEEAIKYRRVASLDDLEKIAVILGIE